MTLRPFAPVFAGLLSFASLPVLAEDPPTELEPMVVTATRTEVREADTLASISVITRADIERAQVNDAAELLRFLAGVEIARAGGPGQVPSIFIRGGSSQQTLVLLDGVRINPTTQGAALQNLTTDMIERIEVVRGPRSTLYGSQAMGGVINVITRRRAGAGGAVAARYGSYDTAELSASGALGGPQAGLRIGASALDSRGFRPTRDSDAQRGYRNATLDLKGDASVGGVVLEGAFWNARGHSAYLEDNDPFCFPCVYDDPASLDFDNRLITTGARMQWGDVDSHLSAAQTLDSFDVVEGIYQGKTRNDRTQLSWQNDWRAAPWLRASLGLDTAHERTVASGVPGAEVRDVSTASLSNELSAGPHRALLAGSLSDHEAFGVVGLWNAEYGYEFATGTRLSVGAGTGFRSPNVLERFYPGFGNPDLGPERSRSYEAGIRQDVGADLRVELRGFITDYEDLIGFDTGTGRNGNVSRARNEGVELSGRWQFADASSLRVGGTLQDPRSCVPGCDSGSRLLRRAPRFGAVQVQTVLSGIDVGADVLGYDRRRDIDSATFAATELPGYVLVNLSAGADLTPHWSLRLKGENLLDRDYETVDGYRQPGLSGSLTTRYQF